MLRSGPAREPARLIVVPKPAGGERRISRLDPADAHDYRQVVASLVPAIEGALGPGVMANRVIGRGSVPWTILEPWRTARRAFAHAQSRQRRRHGWMLFLDVRDCYGSVSRAALQMSLRDVACDRRAIGSVLRVLDRFTADGIPGLPAGPDPSAILANAILSLVDRALSRAGAAPLRWVDDISICAEDERGVRRGLDVAGEALATLGLGVQEQKTRIVPPGERLRAPLVSHSSRTPLS